MKKIKLNYKIIDPNAPEKSADYIYRLFIEVNKNKVERALQEAAKSKNDEQNVMAACENS